MSPVEVESFKRRLVCSGKGTATTLIKTDDMQAQ
jgi:hypothetical protein